MYTIVPSRIRNLEHSELAVPARSAFVLSVLEAGFVCEKLPRHLPRTSLLTNGRQALFAKQIPTTLPSGPVLRAGTEPWKETEVKGLPVQAPGMSAMKSLSLA